MGSGSWVMGYGCQPLDEGAEHPLNHVGTSMQLGKYLPIQVSLIKSGSQLTFQFARGALGDVEELQELTCALSAAALGDVGHDGDHRPPHLPRELELFVARKACCGPIDRPAEKPGLLPDSQLPEVSHSEVGSSKSASAVDHSAVLRSRKARAGSFPT